MIAVAVIPSLLAAQNEQGPYVLLGVLRRLEGHDFPFDSGVARHWQWHREHRDRFVWHAWNIRFGERVGGLVFASFNHSAVSLDSPVAPAEDWENWRSTGAPHAEFTNLEAYRYLPELSRGSGDPGAATFLEFTTVEVEPAAATAFEAKIKARQPTMKEETLWYRLVAGGNVPKYLRLRPRSSFSAVIEGSEDAVLAQAASIIARLRVELLVTEPSLTIDVGGAGRR